MHFEITKQFIDNIKESIEKQDESLAVDLLDDLHPADIAELYDNISIEEAKFLFLLLDGERAADVLSELDDDDRERFLKELPSDVIAKVFIEHMNSDDAADVIADLPEDRQDEVLSHVEDIEHAGDIVDLLDYEENTAGGLMQKEYVSVNITWDVQKCIEEIRNQYEEVDEIFYIYVTDEENIFKGVLSLKRLIIAKPERKINSIYDPEAIYVKTGTDSEEVANLMDKYDIVSLPVVDTIGRLVGQITIDDIVDVLREEAERDYQMATGLSEDVEITDSVWRLTRARIPWLMFGLFGGVLASKVIGLFEEDLTRLAATAFFLPLIASTAGNVGIQSSSIVVQSLATNSMGFHGFWKKLLKELSVAFINAISISAIIFLYNTIFSDSYVITFSVSVSLFIVIIFASVFGSIIPLGLDKLKIDPAIATGPFITITNDLAGMSIYLIISRIFYNLLA
ncbi:MAG: magnesium transporter [Bacteroidales bacterium]|nr:magnesium transporter [Bacteroidales bacterium]